MQVSPGVNFSEIDNSTSIPAVSTSVGAFVGNFRWGPVDEITLVSSEQDLLKQFAPPNSVNTVDYHIASYFLKYSSSLNVLRAVSSAAKSANAGGASVTIKNRSQYETTTFVFATHGLWLAKYPGALGNSLKVSVFGFYDDAATTLTNFNAWAYASSFSGPPGTSDTVSALGCDNDEIHVAVIDEDGLFTGVPGTVLEVFPFLSSAINARKSDGSSIFYKDVINKQSKYIWFAAHDTTNIPQAGVTAVSGAGTDYAVAPVSGVINNSLTGGVDSAALGNTEFSSGWSFFSDVDTVDISLMIGANAQVDAGVTIANTMIAIAEQRKDCVVFISPEADQITAADIKTQFDSINSSSYAVYDSGRAKVYDRFNDQFINIPTCSSVAGLCAQADDSVGPWVSPAGLKRGQLRGITKLYFNPNKAERDLLYKASVNPVVTFPGEGTLLFGDKTGLGRPSAFDRINVRRLFILLEKAISKAARSQLFEFNDEFTRNGFVALVEPFLRTIKGRGGLYDYRVVCDTTNNTTDIIDGNQFVGDIYLSPARSINFIQLNFIATRTGGIQFNEIAGA